MKIVNGDIELIRLSLSNTEELFKVTDKNRNYLRQWLPWVDSTKSPSDSQNFIQSTLDNKNCAQFGIWYKGKLVGAIGFNSIHKENRKGTIGYWLDEDSQGKGIMTTACNLIINYGFKNLDLNRIEISCAVDNKKSCAIPQRLGFIQEGTLHESEWLYDHFVDHNIFALLKKNWKDLYL